MHKYIIERRVPGLGKLSSDELAELSARSNSVLRDLGSDIQWLESYVTGDKLYCVYLARDEAIIREHAECGGFPCDSISRVGRSIDPTTANR